MKKLFIVLFLLGCEQKHPISIKQTDNVQFNVELLFHHDGCKVYRFVDGYTHYFTNCTETRSAHSETCGKGCTKTVYQNIRGTP